MQLCPKHVSDISPDKRSVILPAGVLGLIAYNSMRQSALTSSADGVGGQTHACAELTFRDESDDDGFLTSGDKAEAELWVPG